ncbi:MAG: nucleoside recognition protein [Bacteroidetes bacterium]|nr:nucleoside recognition protein [Bacteroidota bacterium]
MLNYIWTFLVLVSLVVAIGYDLYDEVFDTYRNGKEFSVTISLTDQSSSGRFRGIAHVTAEYYNAHYGKNVLAHNMDIPIQCTVDSVGNGTFQLFLPEQAPQPWLTMAKYSPVKGSLLGVISRVRFVGTHREAHAVLCFEPTHFVKMRSVTQAAIDFVVTAVEIALGLIGVMALWLGLMKIAEVAGLLTFIAKILKPLTRKLFPDIPSDHPAIAAILMNTAANMLGLSNAATPLGLKAMEELNKLNPQQGIATNAMITFLAINTGGLVLIPATAIAVRAAAGSSNPGIIIGTSIIGALCATIAGVTASKVLQRFSRYNNEITNNEKEK